MRPKYSSRNISKTANQNILPPSPLPPLSIKHQPQRPTVTSSSLHSFNPLSSWPPQVFLPPGAGTIIPTIRSRAIRYSLFSSSRGWPEAKRPRGGGRLPTDTRGMGNMAAQPRRLHLFIVRAPRAEGRMSVHAVYVCVYVWYVYTYITRERTRKKSARRGARTTVWREGGGRRKGSGGGGGGAGGGTELSLAASVREKE